MSSVQRRLSRLLCIYNKIPKGGLKKIFLGNMHPPAINVAFWGEMYPPAKKVNFFIQNVKKKNSTCPEKHFFLLKPFFIIFNPVLVQVLKKYL